MAAFDPGERRASTWGCAGGIVAVGVVLFLAVTAVVMGAVWLWR